VFHDMDKTGHNWTAKVGIFFPISSRWNYWLKYIFQRLEFCFL